MKDFKKSTVYQIYPRSFNDASGDGIGDLVGITQKLDYLETLGVDYIWLTPFYPSPQKDNGYDVADYYHVDPIFGTMVDFETLVKAANMRGIDVMLDMVFNHTSTKHQWFKNALSGNEKYKNFYIFKEGSPGSPPTNWASKFGGSAWEYVDKLGEYYLHLFDVTQGDLNWENPAVRDEIYKIVNFWLGKGVKGFRLDVINLISKPDIFENDTKGDGRRFYTDGPKIHDYLKELNAQTFGNHSDVVTVGEMSSTSIDSCIKYSNPDEKELSMVFNFHHLKVDYKDGDKWTLMDFDFKQLKSIFKAWQEGIQSGNGWSAVFWCNHDQPRVVSRFGNVKHYHQESAKMLATAVHLMRGTPYIYQGEEFGMPNPAFKTIDEYRDVESINYYHILKEQRVDEAEILKILAAKSRDNARTPMQWSREKSAGFTSGVPWINVGENYTKINAELALQDKHSIFYHYQKLIKLRKEYDLISHGTIKIIMEDHPHVLAYEREWNGDKLIVINNFYPLETQVLVPEIPKSAEILISNYKNTPGFDKVVKLRPYESIAWKVSMST